MTPRAALDFAEWYLVHRDPLFRGIWPWPTDQWVNSVRRLRLAVEIVRRRTRST